MIELEMLFQPDVVLKIPEVNAFLLADETFLMLLVHVLKRLILAVKASAAELTARVASKPRRSILSFPAHLSLVHVKVQFLL
jgi:hypothetical protein